MGSTSVLSSYLSLTGAEVVGTNHLKLDSSTSCTTTDHGPVLERLPLGCIKRWELLACSFGRHSNTHLQTAGVKWALPSAKTHLSLTRNRGTVFLGAMEELFSFLLNSLLPLPFCFLTWDKPVQPLDQHTCRSSTLSVEGAASSTAQYSCCYSHTVKSHSQSSKS